MLCVGPLCSSALMCARACTHIVKEKDQKVQKEFSSLLSIRNFLVLRESALGHIKHQLSSTAANYGLPNPHNCKFSHLSCGSHNTPCFAFLYGYPNGLKGE